MSTWDVTLDLGPLKAAVCDEAWFVRLGGFMVQGLGDTMPVTFSERHGYRRFWHVGVWRVRIAWERKS